MSVSESLPETAAAKGNADVLSKPAVIVGIDGTMSDCVRLCFREMNNLSLATLQIHFLPISSVFSLCDGSI